MFHNNLVIFLGRHYLPLRPSTLGNVSKVDGRHHKITSNKVSQLYDASQSVHQLVKDHGKHHVNIQ